MKLGIGIDTGGTYTDAVLYDFKSRTILGSAKSLTTKDDLTIGILGAIDGLPQELVQDVKMISLSTTLATNACVEDKGGRAKLIFFGADRKVIDQVGKECGLPPADEMLLYETAVGAEPDWDHFLQEIETGFENLDGVGVIEMNAMRSNASVERKAKALFQQKHKIPVVCGHELFSERNALKRGAGTLLNAGLFPVIDAFLASVKKALAIRGIRPDTLVIVRSDGSLMSEEFAAMRPVETLLCGPAASAIGCTHLTDQPDSIVVDMGGTTTDIAFIHDGFPVTATNGVSIGKWKTFVNGLYVKTFGLGGDSAVHYSGKEVFLEEYRIVPLCVAAAKYPAIIEQLKAMPPRKHTKYLYEHYMLIKDIEESSRYTEAEKAFCRVIREKPLPIMEAAAAVGKDIYTLHIERLLQEGVVQICGLTPTDIMHIKGDFSRYDAEASRLGAEFAAFNLDITVEELCDRVYNAVHKKLYVNIVKSMLENKDPYYMKNGISADIERFILTSYEEAKNHKSSPLFSILPQARYSLVGVGAPIRVFLETVADLLGTHAYFPERYEVANALGAIIGSISASCKVEIRPDTTVDGIVGYIVAGGTNPGYFKEFDDALAFAITEAETGAKENAEKHGAVGDIHITHEVLTNEAGARELTVYLGTAVVAHATGTLGF